MKTKWITLFTIALIAADVLQTAYAAEPEASQSAATIATVLPAENALERTEVHGLAVPATTVNYPEFGAGSHTNMLSTHTREEVKAEALQNTHPEKRTYFNY
jgi:hypothetical protein